MLRFVLGRIAEAGEIIGAEFRVYSGPVADRF
jgi:hypothetical protein